MKLNSRKSNAGIDDWPTMGQQSDSYLLDFSSDSSHSKGPTQPALYNPMNQRVEPNQFNNHGVPASKVDYNYGLGGVPQKFMTPSRAQNRQQSQQPHEQFLNPADLANNAAVAEFALQYSQNLARTGGVVLNQRVERFLSVTKLKHYFAVDTNYVLKKLQILIFPFTHKEWHVNYTQEDPVAPQFDVNVPDLYIPSMAFVTYILLAGVCLGSKNRFTPEDLGIVGSSALAWYLLELVVIYILTFILSINASFRSFIDVFAFCGYKFFSMMLLLLSSLVGGSGAYYAAWIYTSITSSFFLVKTLRLCILSNVSQDSFVQHSGGQKRKWYFMLYFAVTQPLLCYWLTTHVAAS